MGDGQEQRPRWSGQSFGSRYVLGDRLQVFVLGFRCIDESGVVLNFALGILLLGPVRLGHAFLRTQNYVPSHNLDLRNREPSRWIDPRSACDGRVKVKSAGQKRRRI